MGKYDRGKGIWDWRSKISAGSVNGGEELVKKGTPAHIERTEDGRGGSADIGKFKVTAENLPITYEEYKECRQRIWGYVRCTCSAFARSSHCKHMAAFLIRWEQEFGPFSADEPLEQYRERIEKGRRERANHPAAKLMAGLPEREERFFHPWDALDQFPADVDEVELAKALLQKGVPKPDFSIINTAWGQCLQAKMLFRDKAETCLKIETGRYWNVEKSCTCRRFVRSYDSESEDSQLCMHELVLLRKTWEYVEAEDPGDLTDDAGRRLMAGLLAPKKKAFKGTKKACTRLIPELWLGTYSSYSLSFKIEMPGGKVWSIRNVQELNNAVSLQCRLAVSSASYIDFAENPLEEESLKWLRFIQLNLNSIQRTNDMINSSHSFYYAASHPANYGYKSTVPVEYETLDAFYDLALGENILLGGTNRTIAIGGDIGTFQIKAVMQKNEQGNIIGAELSGNSPDVAEGLVYKYLVSGQALRRVTEEEIEQVRPFMREGRGIDNFHAVIGRKMISRFVMETLPALAAHPLVKLEIENMNLKFPSGRS